MAPIAPRLLLFLFSHIIIFASLFFCYLYHHSIEPYKALKKIIIFVTFILVFLNVSTVSQSFNFATQPDTVTPAIEYVKKNIKADEHLYSFITGNQLIKYERNYSDRIGASAFSIMYGQCWYDWANIEVDRATLRSEECKPWDIIWDNGQDAYYPNEIQRIADARKVYLLFTSLIYYMNYDYGIEELKKYGRIEEVMKLNNTRLYYFDSEEKYFGK